MMDMRKSPTIKNECKKIGENISLWRRINKIPVESLAERTGLSKSTLHRIEAGEPGVSIAAIVCVLRVMNMTTALSDALDPSMNAWGRAQLTQGVPKKVR